MTDRDGSPGEDRELRGRGHVPAPDPVTPGDRADPTAKAGRGQHAGARHKPGTLPAQQRLMRQIAAGRRARQQRALLTILGGMSALVLLASGSAWMLTSYVTGHLHRLSVGTSGTPSSGPLNILVAGVDIRSGLSRRAQLRLHVGRTVSHNSDTLMVAHVPADHSYVQVVSLPRDSWVSIPGHGMNKINAAFGIGGPQLMVRTVEAATGLTINDYIEVNFLGFVRVIDAIGGVRICLPFPVNDSYSGLHMSAGVHHVNGITALKFARDRHSFAASDLARIGNQQQLLATMLSQAVTAGTLTDPLKLKRLLSAVTAAIRVDQGFNVVSLAGQLRGIRPSNVTFSTVPLASASYLTPTGQSAVLWNNTQATKLFSLMRRDQSPVPVSGGRHRHRHRHHGGERARSRGAGAAQTSSPGGPKTAAQAACR